MKRMLLSRSIILCKCQRLGRTLAARRWWSDLHRRQMGIGREPDVGVCARGLVLRRGHRRHEAIAKPPGRVMPRRRSVTAQALVGYATWRTRLRNRWKPQPCLGRGRRWLQASHCRRTATCASSTRVRGRAIGSSTKMTHHRSVIVPSV